MSNAITSASVTIKPADTRCRFWAKIVRLRDSLPLPSEVHGAANIPAAFVRIGEDELFPGDVLIEGEERHHRVNRGWRYMVTFCRADGSLWGPREPTAAMKVFAKANGIDPALLPGSGELAACVRIAHCLRNGIKIEV